MAIELVVPTVGESITEVEVGAWLKAPGDFVRRDEAIVEIESDKATVEVFAPVDGKLVDIVKQTGESASIGDLIGHMEAAEIPAEIPAAAASVSEKEGPPPAAAVPSRDGGAQRIMPAARRVLAQRGIDAGQVAATGPGGRLLKEDVERHSQPAPVGGAVPAAAGAREEEVVRMTPMRRRIAEHLVTAQQTAALLTTFNEVDMTAVMDLRREFKDVYETKYGVRLGFMSFFVKASIEALRMIPQVNGEIRGTDIVYKNYYDIGVAISGKKGLLVPVLRNAERMSFAEIEAAIGDLGRRAQTNKITIEELQGGTFTISNGGVFGSLLSTPIVNPPQSGVLGMHTIQQRPVVVGGEIVARPMMYLALTYDHRIVDGREAVTFLKRIKECIENPARILLEV